MQRRTSNESEIKIPPNLLKNFNAYETLEPQKNGANNNDATKVDKLIDIDDCSRDSGFQDSDLHPAFLDKNRDFDLVDLFQNILVSPHHIKKKENDATDEDHANNVSTVVDAGFKHFFDMLESGQKVDWANIAQPEEETITKHDFIEKKPRVLVPKVFTEPDSDPEDLIHEVLMQKTLEKLALDSNNSSPQVMADELPERESPKKINEKHNHVLAVAQSAKKSEIIQEYSRSSCINCISKGSRFDNGSYQKVSRPSETYSDSQLNNSSTNFTVKAIQKDEKLYKKKRILKPESQTANYTKGPDFYEKSVVLPQIMARLHAQLAYLDEKSNQKKILILDAGANPVKAECSSAFVNAQVKKPNNQASSGALNVKQQVKTKPESSTFTKNVLTTKVQNIASTSDIHSQKMNNIHIRDEARLCTNKLTKDIRVHTTDKQCMNCGNPSTSKKAYTPEVSSTKTDGKLSPIVLMDDCNKERLRALKQSQKFKEFVLTGKLSYEG